MSTRRNVAATKIIPRAALKLQDTAPSNSTLDDYDTSHRAVREMQDQGEIPKAARLRSSKYLSNMINQNHRNVKLRTIFMLGFKRFNCAANTIAGIDLMHRNRKG